jgi:hypothetical protein
VNRRLRCRFSLATLLVAVMWSAVVLWLDTSPGEVPGKINEAFGPGYRWLHYGWPFTYAWYVTRLRVTPTGLPFAWHSWALVADVAIGLLFVVVLTWTSSLLLRRITARLRRRSTAKLGEQQLDSRAE